MAATTLHAEERWRFTVLGIIVVCHFTHTSGLIMVPEKAVLVVLEGDKLELQCIHQYENDSTPNSLFFKKGDEILNGIVTHPVLDGNTWTDTYTYTKDKAVTGDTGEYKCLLQNIGGDSSINVFVIRMPILEDVELVEGAPTASLVCDLQDVNGDQLVYKMSWSHDNKTIVEGDRFTLVNNTLEITKPVRADMGDYECIVTFFPDDTRGDKHIFRPGAAALLARPAIVSSDNNKNMVQGDEVELKCKVSGFPQPEVTWLKDEVKVNSTQRVHFVEYEGAKTGKLKLYSLAYEDEGTYKCLASNEINGMSYNATGAIVLKVKDKLAALWPFLGIVAEVIILCAIILCYEKSRSKKLADEDDGPDGNVENTVDHGDVRHRRT